MGQGVGRVAEGEVLGRFFGKCWECFFWEKP